MHDRVPSVHKVEWWSDKHSLAIRIMTTKCTLATLHSSRGCHSEFFIDARLRWPPAKLLQPCRFGCPLWLSQVTPEWPRRDRSSRARLSSAPSGPRPGRRRSTCLLLRTSRAASCQPACTHALALHCVARCPRQPHLTAKTQRPILSNQHVSIGTPPNNINHCEYIRPQPTCAALQRLPSIQACCSLHAVFGSAHLSSHTNQSLPT